MTITAMILTPFALLLLIRVAVLAAYKMFTTKGK